MDNYTGHDVNHSINVIYYVNKIIDVIEEHGNHLSQTEILLLYLSSWLHDIGNLDSREYHSLASCYILDELDGISIELGELKTPLFAIIRNHQSRYGLENIDAKERRIKGDLVRVRLLCGLFKLADECHMGADRASPTIFKVLEGDLKDDMKALKLWKANAGVFSVDFDSKAGQIVVSVSDIDTTAILTDKLRVELERVSPYVQDFFPIKSVSIDVWGELEALGGPVPQG